jgi:hypothetical protein
MLEKKNFNQKIFVLFIIAIFSFATFLPNVVGIPSSDSSKSKDFNLKNRVSFGKLFRNLMIKVLSDRPSPNGVLRSSLFTNCDGLEKETEIRFARVTEIDIDDNPDTGLNGKDISVNYLILPWLNFEYDIGLGLTFTVYIERLNDDLKDRDFSASIEIAQKTIVLGFRSPDEPGNEIPGSIQLSFNTFFYILKRTRGFSLALDPVYNSGNDGKKLELFAEYNGDDTQKQFNVLFEPAIKTEIGFISTKKQGVWNYDFTRVSSDDCKITTTFRSKEEGQFRDIIFTVDKLPKDLKFSLGLTPLAFGGGRFLYESSETYDIELQVQSEEMGTCGYSYLRNTPTRLYAEWIPTFINGEYHIELDSEGTDFILKDDLDNPYINLEVNSLQTINVDAYWNLSNPGDFAVYKDTDVHVDLNFSIGDWIARLDVEPIAKNITTTWFIDAAGYMSIDTNWEPFSTMILEIKGPNIGLWVSGESFKSEDFNIAWTLWPPQEWDLSITGSVDASEITSIYIYFIDRWYRLWPL